MMKDQAGQTPAEPGAYILLVNFTPFKAWRTVEDLIFAGCFRVLVQHC